MSPSSRRQLDNSPTEDGYDDKEYALPRWRRKSKTVSVSVVGTIVNGTHAAEKLLDKDNMQL